MSDNVDNVIVLKSNEKLRDFCEFNTIIRCYCWSGRAKRFIINFMHKHIQCKRTWTDRRTTDWSVSKFNLQIGNITLHCLWLIAWALALSHRIFTHILHFSLWCIEDIYSRCRMHLVFSAIKYCLLENELSKYLHGVCRCDRFVSFEVVTIWNHPQAIVLTITVVILVINFGLLHSSNRMAWNLLFSFYYWSKKKTKRDGNIQVNQPIKQTCANKNIYKYHIPMFLLFGAVHHGDKCTFQRFLATNLHFIHWNLSTNNRWHNQQNNLEHKKHTYLCVNWLNGHGNAPHWHNGRVVCANEF